MKLSMKELRRPHIEYDFLVSRLKMAAIYFKIMFTGCSSTFFKYTDKDVDFVKFFYFSYK